MPGSAADRVEVLLWLASALAATDCSAPASEDSPVGWAEHLALCVTDETNSYASDPVVSWSEPMVARVKCSSLMSRVYGKWATGEDNNRDLAEAMCDASREGGCPGTPLAYVWVGMIEQEAQVPGAGGWSQVQVDTAARGDLVAMRYVCAWDYVGGTWKDACREDADKDCSEAPEPLCERGVTGHVALLREAPTRVREGAVETWEVEVVDASSGNDGVGFRTLRLLVREGVVVGWTWESKPLEIRTEPLVMGRWTPEDGA